METFVIYITKYLSNSYSSILDELKIHGIHSCLKVIYPTVLCLILFSRFSLCVSHYVDLMSFHGCLSVLCIMLLILNSICFLSLFWYLCTLFFLWWCHWRYPNWFSIVCIINMLIFISAKVWVFTTESKYYLQWSLNIFVFIWISSKLF